MLSSSTSSADRLERRTVKHRLAAGDDEEEERSMGGEFFSRFPMRVLHSLQTSCLEAGMNFGAHVFSVMRMQDQWADQVK